jgi:transcription elongation factor Elf1
MRSYQAWHEEFECRECEETTPSGMTDTDESGWYAVHCDNCGEQYRTGTQDEDYQDYLESL